MSDERLPANRRLRRPSEFKRAYSEGRRVGNELLTAACCRNEQGTARLGLSIAARVLKRAVDRNRVRRIIRDSFRRHRAQLPPFDIVIGARGAIVEADNARLRAALERLWQKIAAACAT